ncbi:MAG: FAD-dependent oxidoreductase [Planctomycetota bacterium]|nr:FAD-dependent oxidoreductase [Planctomycetota bacterium]
MRGTGRWQRWILAGAGVALLVVVILVGPPAMHLARTWLSDRDELEELPAGIIDDASRMNATSVKEIWAVPGARDEAEHQLAELLRRADAQSLPVSIAGARHSMGGHVIAPDGLVINMLPFDDMELDEESNILHVQAGATWKEIIEYLDRHGMSVGVMQSNNSFSVGGSLSVNCHGWQYGRPPIASTVRSFRLMRADGSIVTCSREENTELFSLVLGGYGLLGIILDVRLDVVPNERLQLEQFVVPIANALVQFEQSIDAHPGASMVYARLNIIPDEFLSEAIVSIFRTQEGAIPALTDPDMIALRRALFRGSAESDYGKELRWSAETELQPLLSPAVFSRNQLLNEGVETFQNRSASSTDILHEYFVPRMGIDTFLDELRRIVPLHDGNLLNVTVRSVDTDKDTFLRYADRQMFAFVMLFQQPRTAEGEEVMLAMTRELIEAALAVDGRYYLPYRLHATRDQFHRAYPMGEEFFERKRHYDPGDRFQNRFYDRYGARDKDAD